MKLKYIFYTILFSILCQTLQGQTLDEAKSMYLEGRFSDALPIFRAEHALAPDNAALNQWLGASLLETGKPMEAQPYLVFASKHNIPEAYLYLGELYAKMYRFADAEREFAKYQRNKRRDKAALEKLEAKRQYISTLKKEISRTEDIQIIDSVLVNKNNFLQAYNLSKAAGTLAPIHEFFKNMPLSDETVYLNERSNKVYYSQAGKLFTMEKLLDTFGNEQKLPENINADGEQAYPFVMPDGVTIYFASSSEQSMGGYDIFATRYNLQSDNYLTPNRLNVPFNSPFNDYMMAIDEEKGIGWFASDRFQAADSVCVYTFIPNPRTTLVESDNPDYLANRARIAAIAQSWNQETDYAPFLAKAKQKSVEKKENSEFEFVINDRVTYHSIHDFKNANARNLFLQATELERLLTSLLQKLTWQRQQFAEGEQNLRTSILENENRTEKLTREIEQLRIDARNEEINAIFKL